MSFSLTKVSSVLIATLSASLTGVALANPVINEFVFNHSGSDRNEFIEIFATPNTDYSDLTVIEIDGDGPAAGTIDGVFPIGSTNSAGFFTTNFLSNNIENGSVTLLLVRDFVGSQGMDIDTNNDGVVDSQPWSAIVDSIAVSDNGSSDHAYAKVVLSQGFDGVSFTVGGASRIPNGIDTDDVTNWQRADFNFGSNDFANAINTPNTVNLIQVEPLKRSIAAVQGNRHLSPVMGQLVTSQGIVTAVAFNGFYLQSTKSDGDHNTSDGVFVLTNSVNAANVGDEVAVTGVVTEVVPGGTRTGNLSVTQIFRPSITTLSSGNPLPETIVIGQSGRIPPNRTVISNNEIRAGINLFDPADAAANRFNPNIDGIDFFESMEGMRVTVEAPVAVSPVRTFNFFSSEVFTVASNGENVAPRNALNARGGIELQADRNNRGDQNPERVQIQFDRTLFGEPPLITVGDRLSDVIGVVGYDFGNFEINATEPVTIIPANLIAETTDLISGAGKLSVASYNVLNLSASSRDNAQRNNIAAQIANNLQQPDVIALQEIQDNNGETNNGVVDATETLQALADAIVVAGGPAYKFVTVNPINGTQGGVPGGNIRNAYLYNPSRVELVRLLALTPEQLTDANVGNPDAFNGSRIPLLATFAFENEHVTVINNHLSSRFGSTPIFGAVQPFVQAGEDNREAQVGALNDYVDFILKSDDNANIIVLGDLNTFQFTDDLRNILPGKNVKNRKDDDSERKDKYKRKENSKRVLSNLVDTLKDDAIYSFIFDGNSQQLDHMFISDALRNRAQFDIVHVNNDFPRVDSSTASDHEPLLGLFDFTHDTSDEREDDHNEEYTDD